MKLITRPLTAALRGELTPPGDKSISHRALIFSSLAKGESEIRGLLQSADVAATAAACQQLGAIIQCQGQGEQQRLRVIGTGERGLEKPTKIFDMGNSGTAMRLLAGVLAAQPFESELMGDASLNRRPMRRIIEPLSRMGARIESTESGTAPLRIKGNTGLRGIEYQLPVASAQIKSCVLLAGLFAKGKTCITEPGQSRDHTERMLPVFGVRVGAGPCVEGGSVLSAANIQVPADISSAAFFMVAAAIIPGSEVLLRNVGINKTRDGIVRVLRAMGADISLVDQRQFGQEPVADIRVSYRTGLQGIDVPEVWVPSLIDELPIIMILATCVEGVSRIRGAEELRVKESDRIAVMAKGLETLGIQIKEYEDGIDIHGSDQGSILGGGEVDGEGDHRCAMSFCIAGQVARETVTVAGASHIDTSYPDFVKHLLQLGGQVKIQPPAASEHAGNA
ncbi:MAG: 3-phosphoshikimate 1-carboxyvinyltransferase [Xanthomonadales bacterium]|nr:3-phosphoshikimate 1-carboxyvinyltransferase [Xanthomonadales bacterium]